MGIILALYPLHFMHLRDQKLSLYLEHFWFLLQKKTFLLNHFSSSKDGWNTHHLSPLWKILIGQLCNIIAQYLGCPSACSSWYWKWCVEGGCLLRQRFLRVHVVHAVQGASIGGGGGGGGCSGGGGCFLPLAPTSQHPCLGPTYKDGWV